MVSFSPLSLPVLLLVWNVAVVWLFLTADSWSSALLLVCICSEVCRVKDWGQKYRYYTPALLLPRICPFLKHLLLFLTKSFNRQTWQESCTWVRAHHDPQRGNTTARGQLIEIRGNIPSCSCLLRKWFHFLGRFRQP